MSVKETHHVSRKRRYSIIVVPSGDAGGSRTYQFALWHLLALALGSVALVVASVLAVLFLTPLSSYVDMPNPALENRFNTELLALNRRMESVVEQLLETRAYNLKLRKALGELVQPIDTAQAVRRTAGRPPAVAESRVRAGESDPSAQNALRPVVALSVLPERESGVGVSFPAMMPTDGYVTQGFDPQSRHFGIDIAGKTGTVVSSAADGNIVFSGWTHDDGFVLILSHMGGFLTFYKHNQALLKSSGTFVRRGEPIALLGNSGHTSLGPHLHFEIWKDGAPVDPVQYLLNINS